MKINPIFAEWTTCADMSYTIKKKQLCDGTIDCFDRSDENNCSKNSNLKF